MNHFATALGAGIVATVVVAGTALTPTPAEAAKTSLLNGAGLILIAISSKFTKALNTPGRTVFASNRQNPKPAAAISPFPIFSSMCCAATARRNLNYA